MSDGEISYRYFRYPHRFSFYTDQKRPCQICRQVRPGYSCAFYGPNTNGSIHICDECLSGGRLAEIEAETNSPNSDPAKLLSAIEYHQPELSENQAKLLERERTQELTQRTPLILAW